MFAVAMIVVQAYIKRDVSRSSCTTWKWLYWMKIFVRLFFNLRHCHHCRETKGGCVDVAGFGDKLCKMDVFANEKT